MRCRIKDNFQSGGHFVTLGDVEPGSIVRFKDSRTEYVYLGKSVGGDCEIPQLMRIKSGLLSWSPIDARVEVLDKTVTVIFGAD